MPAACAHKLKAWIERRLLARTAEIPATRFAPLAFRHFIEADLICSPASARADETQYRPVFEVLPARISRLQILAVLKAIFSASAQLMLEDRLSNESDGTIPLHLISI